MKKAFDQTVREIKREVNKKVLKVPNIEQKILDATSNEPWGPHGTLLADIAQATRNHHEYQMIMSVVWKRISDTGKNWRHVYKALTVLEYLVGHGSERVIDEIREHAYQISTLSDFQYIDSSGKDQGSNVRRKSQILVALVNDKEKIQEARQKALANKDKYRNSFSTGGSYGPSSYSGGYGNCYDDDRYEGKYGNGYEDQNSYRRERDWGYRDDDRYGRDGDSYNREGDQYGRDPDARSVSDNHKEDDYRGNHGNDDYRFGTRNRSFDRDGVRSFDDDDRYSTRNASARADESSQDERRLEHRLSEPNVGAPPSYEEATRNAQNRMQEERSRNGGTMTQTAAKASSPPAPKAGYIETTSPGQEHAATSASATGPNEEADAFDEFDPRGSSLVPPPVANSLEIDLFGSLSASDSTNSLALMPVTSSTTSEADISANSAFGMNFVPLSSASNVLSQPAENPFGDTPFKAIPQENFPAQQQNFAPATSFQTSGLTVGSGHLPSVAPEVETVPAFDFGDSLGGITYAPSVANGAHSPANSGTFATELPGAQVSSSALGHFLPQTGHAAVISPRTAQQGTATIIQTDNLNKQTDNLNKLPQTGPSAPVPSQVPSVFSQTMQTGTSTIRQAAATPNLPPQSGFSTPAASQASSSTSGIPPAKVPPSKDKFEPKSTVWADTLSRGLVNLNISGPKINPLADIGIDFESINRMEKRKEKASATPATSTVTMGKAMGSGSGMGRAGASSLVAAPNPMIGSGLGRGMCIGGSPGMGMSMGAYGGSMNGPIGTGMGMGMGMAMNMGVGQAAPMRTPTGMAPGPGMPGVSYNPMMGMGSYGSQQPYRGGY